MEIFGEASGYTLNIDINAGCLDDPFSQGFSFGFEDTCVPEFIIDNGGIVLFAQYNDEIVGTVALMYLEDENCFELTKMAVSPLQFHKSGNWIIFFVFNAL